jgi:hypothetical protein
MLSQLRSCEIHQISLHVLRSNDSAVRLYSSHGFEIVCMLKDYYSLSNQSGDAYWMRMDLSKPKRTFEAPLFDHSVRVGPWPFGMSFEIFILLIFAGISLLLFLYYANMMKQYQMSL